MAAPRECPLLLIAGIPATGKSRFCDWLANEKGYIHVEMDRVLEDPIRSHELGLDRPTSGTQFVSALRGLGPRIALEWGFDPDNLPQVKQCKTAGMELWWFDGDIDKARQVYIERLNPPVECFDHQVPKLIRHREAILATFTPNIIQVLPATGPCMGNPEIWTRLGGAGDETPV